uniref:PH domain-containing protein n=1 Tax=Macrostomum lignano TaxID=282301 RepID=A0A1I8I7I0_9PLAT
MMDANGNGNDMADALGTPSASTSSSTPIAQARTGKLQGLLKSQCQDPGSGGSSVSSPTPTQKKSVSFLSSSFDKGIRVIDAPDCVNYMRDGTELLKIRSSGRHFKRFFFLDTETMEIRWHPSSKKRQKAKCEFF